jgi:hypothetical protein
MSSPRAAVKAVRKPVKSLPAARKAKAQTADASSQALALAAEIERGLLSGKATVVSKAAQQKLLAALCKSYAQQVQAGEQASAVGSNSGLSATDVMITTSALLKAADLQVFELGMWQSWTGR